MAITAFPIQTQTLFDQDNTWTGENVYDSPDPVVVGVDEPLGGAITTSKMIISNGGDSSDNTVLISRYDVGGPGTDSHALRVLGYADPGSTSQLNSIEGVALGHNAKDVVAVFGTAQKNENATGNAFGAFFQAYNFVAGAGAYAIQTDVQNQTGVAYPYTQSYNQNKFIGIDLVYDTDAIGKDSGCAMQVRKGAAPTSGWDVGIGVQGTSIKTSFIDNDSDCIKLWNDTGVHTTGLDFSAATFSGNAFSSPGFAVDGSGNLSALSLVETGSWTTFTSTATSGTGSITTQASNSKYKKIGKTVLVSIDVTITAVGTGSGTLTLSLPPFTSGGTMVIPGREAALSGKALNGVVGNGGSSLAVVNYDNTNPSMGNGAEYVLTGVYMST